MIIFISQRDAHFPSNTTHVPPGYGKPATHSRNQRRRKRREMLKLVGEAPSPETQPPNGASDVNSLPLGRKKIDKPQKQATQTISMQDNNEPTEALVLPGDQDQVASSGEPVYMTPDQLMMGNLRNKNKKKGFKLSMANPIPQKIIFNEPLTSPHDRQMDVDVDLDADVDEPGPSAYVKYQPRLIPPSEIQEQGGLPPNMFVTSVDVEAGMWDEVTSNNTSSKSKSKRKNKKKQMQEQEQEQDEWYDHAHAETQYLEADADVTLSYDDDDGGAGADAQNTQFDWDKAEKTWEKAKSITDETSLNPGTIVGWKVSLFLLH